MANEAILPIVVTLKDEASAGLQRTRQQVGFMSRDVKVAASALGRFGQAMTNILVLTNLLPGKLGATVNKTLLLGTTTLNAVYAVSQLVSIYGSLNKALQTSITLQTVLAALQTKIGLGSLAGVAGRVGLAGAGAVTAGGLGAAAGVALPVAAGVAFQGGMAYAAWHYRAQIRGAVGGVINNFFGPVLGTPQELAQRLTAMQRENTRLGR